MITDDLFERALIEPAKNGCNKLFIVSGYATAAMAFHHLDFLKSIGKNISIELLVGMCPDDGISLSNHRGFQQLMENDFPDTFSCSYIINPPAVHSKIYSWFSDNNPNSGYIGSANYTQTAFKYNQREIMDVCDASDAKEYFDNLLADSIYCTHLDSENFIQIYNDKYYVRRKKVKEILPELETGDKVEDTTGLSSVSVSLLDRNGNLAQRSGLNWGQRPEEKREPNQAYIRLTADIYKTDFFPPRKVHFTLLTDDSKVLICTRAQDNSKAIHTPHNNSLIGEYFRNRLNVQNGAPIRTEVLVNYGRTDVDFYKIDEETFFMDFSI